MSELMLHAVLNMPPDIWSNTELDIIQRHGWYVEASKTIDSLQSICDELRNEKIRDREDTIILRTKLEATNKQLMVILEQRDTARQQIEQLRKECKKYKDLYLILNPCAIDMVDYGC